METKDEQKYSVSGKIKSKLLQVIIQELRSPMSAIIGFIDLLKESPGGEESLMMFETINKASTKSKELLDLAQVISEIEPGKFHAKMRPYKIGKLIEYAIKDNSQLIQSKNIRYILPLDIETSELVIDPDSIKEILRILLSCAITKCPEHGIINIGINEKPDNIELSVITRGNPFSDEELLRIQSFVRSVDMLTKTSWPDLRLVAIQFILLLHQASLWVSNTKEGDTVIKMIFPINIPQSEALHKILAELN